MKVLANDGISNSGIEKLESNGFEVITETVSQVDLIDYINTNNIDALLVRSATKVRKDLIDNCKSIKLIGRGGVGVTEKGGRPQRFPLASSGSLCTPGHTVWGV